MKIYIIADCKEDGPADIWDMRFFTSKEEAWELAKTVINQIKRYEVPWVIGIDIYQVETDYWNEEPELVYDWHRKYDN